MVFVVAFAFACTNEKKQNEPDLKSTEITFRVEPLSVDSSKIILNFVFTSDSPRTFLLNWDALSIYDPNLEKDNLLDKDTVLNHVIESLSYPQFVLENESGEKRFFTDITLFEGETIQMKDVFSFEDRIDTIRIEPNSQARAKSEAIDINRLKIKQTDNKIRLHYLFTPTDEQKLTGYKTLRLSSNWFQLK